MAISMAIPSTTNKKPKTLKIILKFSMVMLSLII